MAAEQKSSSAKGGASKAQSTGALGGGVKAPIQAGLTGGGDTSAGLTFETVKHLIEQSEKIAQAKFESLQEAINRKLSRLDHVPSYWQMAGIIFTSVVAGAGVIIAIVAYASDRFDGGVGLGTEIGSKFAENRIEIERNAARDAETRESVDRLIGRMDELIERLGEPTDDN